MINIFYLACVFYSLFHPISKETSQTLSLEQLKSKVADLVYSIEELYNSPTANANYLYVDNITYKEHALQSAYLAQRNNPHVRSLIAAALLHDLTYLLGEQEHSFACNFLKPIWGEEVAQPILCSSIAQRFLAAVDSGYASKLSSAGQLVLTQHGGALMQDSPEYASFRRNSHFERAITLRRCHDEARAIDKDTPALEDFHDLLVEVAIEHLYEAYPVESYQECLAFIEHMQEKIQAHL